MTAMPRTSTSTRPAPRNDTTRFFDAILQGQDTGVVHLGYIAGDPEHDKHTPAGDLKFAGWQKASNRAVLATKADELGGTYGDAYMRRTAFRSRDFAQANALPSMAIFADDPKQHLDSTNMLVQTSEYSYQGWWFLDKPATHEVIRELQALAKAATGGDDCHSVDHFVRIPGTWNTKRGGRFLVRITKASQRRYTVDELRALFLSWQPAGAHATTPRSTTSTRQSFTSADVTAFEKKHSDLLEHYGEHFAAMLSTTDGVQHPKSFGTHATHQGYKVCAGTLKIMNDAGTDLDYSDLRAAFIKSCVLARYDDAATYVLTLHFCQYRDTLQVAQIDTVRYLARVRGQLPHIKPWPRTFRTVGTLRPQTVVPIETPPPAARRTHGPGRPARLDTDRFYAMLLDLAQHDGNGEPIVAMTRAELTEHIRATIGPISTRTLASLEQQLRTAGRIGARYPTDQYHASYLTLTPAKDDVLPHATITPDPMQQLPESPPIVPASQTAVCSIPMPQIENSADAALKGTYAHPTPAPDPAPAGASGGHVPCDAAASPVPVTPAEMVREALDANSAGLVRRHMATRVKQTARYIVDNFDGRTVDPAKLARCIKAEQDRRRYAAEALHLQTLDNHELQRALRAGERQQARAHEKNRPRQAAMFGMKLQAIRNEYKRRGIDSAARMPRLKRALPKKPAMPLPLLDDSPMGETCATAQTDPPPPPPNPAPAEPAVLAQDGPKVPSVVIPPPTEPTVWPPPRGDAYHNERRLTNARAWLEQGELKKAHSVASLMQDGLARIRLLAEIEAAQNGAT